MTEKQIRAEFRNLVNIRHKNITFKQIITLTEVLKAIGEVTYEKNGCMYYCDGNEASFVFDDISFSWILSDEDGLEGTESDQHIDTIKALIKIFKLWKN